MKREILFKGKRTLDGEWVYGYYWTSPDTTNYIRSITNRTTDHLVFPRTVGQYTGLKDKNGVKIFEGDKVSFVIFDYNDHDTSYEGYVVYDGSRFMIWNNPDNEYYGSDGGFDLDYAVYQDDELEVIGNIHDNKDLL